MGLECIECNPVCLWGLNISNVSFFQERSPQEVDILVEFNIEPSSANNFLNIRNLNLTIELMFLNESYTVTLERETQDARSIWLRVRFAVSFTRTRIWVTLPTSSNLLAA